MVIGLEVDYYAGQMDTVAGLLAGYPFDVLLGSVHWLGAWRFDDLDDPVSMGEWSARQVDDCWEAYTAALEELAASGACDVLAHPDLIKVAGHIPDAPAEWWDRMAEAAASSGMAAELSSAGWRKPVGEQYPALPLLERFVAAGRAADHGLGRPPARAGGRPRRRPAGPARPGRGGRPVPLRPGASPIRAAAGAACRLPRRARRPSRAHTGRAGPVATPPSSPSELEHLQRLLGQLERAGRPVLLRPLAAGPGARRPRAAALDDPELVVLGQMRPNNRPTLVDQDLVGHDGQRVAVVAGRHAACTAARSCGAASTTRSSASRSRSRTSRSASTAR